jgi:carbonic anhydrase
MKLIPFPAGSLLLATLLLGAGCQSTPPSGTAARPPAQTRATQAATTPAAALAELRAGNERFATGRLQVRDLTAQREATAAGQYPFAAVLSCLDSRCSAEQVFDQGVGDIFSARVAGNVLNDDILGSLEFACNAAGARLIAVVGHSKCGAVKGACQGVQLGHLTGLLDKIRPAISRVSTNSPAGAEQVEQVAAMNVRLVLEQIRERSPILTEMIRDGRIGLVGGMYDLDTGRVNFFE